MALDGDYHMNCPILNIIEHVKTYFLAPESYTDNICKSQSGFKFLSQKFQISKRTVEKK